MLVYDIIVGLEFSEMGSENVLPETVVHISQ